MLSALHEDIVSSGDKTGSSAEDAGGRCCGGQVCDGEELSSAVGDLRTGDSKWFRRSNDLLLVPNRSNDLPMI